MSLWCGGAVVRWCGGAVVRFRLVQRFVLSDGTLAADSRVQ
ncbi:hypothetical protein [Actinopolymorpha sp. B9G3]